MKLKALLSALLIAALLCPAALMEEALNEPLPALEEAMEPASVEDGEEPEQPEDSVPADSEEEVLLAEPVDETVEEVDFEEDYAYFEAEVDDDVEFVSDEAADGVAAGGDIDINSNFPDSVFREYIRKECDWDNNGVLSTQERSGITEIILGLYVDTDASKKIKDLTGIKYFKNLQRLSIHGHLLSALDVSGCTNLASLYCDNNLLTSLNASGCTNLKLLWCYDNQLTSLNVSGCTNLEDLKCYDNQLTSLDVSGCTNLDRLDCSCNTLTTLNIRDCINPSSLSCHDNRFSKLNVPECTKLYYLSCSYNQIVELDISKCTGLWCLFCDNNQLKALDISNTSLGELYCENNKLTTLDIRNSSALVEIKEEEYFDDSNPLYYEYYYHERLLRYDRNVTVIGGNHDPNSAPKNQDLDNTAIETSSSVTPVAPAPAPAPAPATPTIPAVKKSGKTTISAAPGSVYQLDLGGASGKAFKSSKKKVAVVNGAGQVTIRGAGKTKITFKVGKKKRTVTLTVKDPTIPTSVSLNPVNTAVKVGESVTLTPVISPETNSTFKWKSSNKKVASVSNGVVTFKKAGKVTITCTAVRGKKKAKVTFRVSK